MKQKLNKGANPFSYKKNVSNYLDGDQQELYKYVTSATYGNKKIAGSVNIYHVSNNQNMVKALVQRMFASRYPASRISAYPKRIAYICKAFNGLETHEQRKLLMNDINEIIKTQRAANLSKPDPTDKTYQTESFPLSVMMKGAKSKKLNEYLKTKGYLTTDEGENFTNETKQALARAGYTTPFSQTDYDKLFVVNNNMNQSNSILSGNNLYIIIAVVIAVAIFFFFKRKKQ